MADGDAPQQEPRYRAFISYSHADRRIAGDLHQRLERYVLPRALDVALPHDKRQLRPIFRDEAELVPGPDLPSRIQSALEAAEHLIVVCSPRSAQSEWVNREVEAFIALGRADRILAVVVDGEPNAVTRGYDAALECLPPALRDRETEAADDSELLWVDWRRNAAGDRIAFLRIVAALLSLQSLDTLVQRDSAARRQRVLLSWTVALVLLIAFSTAAWLYTLQMKSAAERRAATLTTVARTAIDAADYESAARMALLGMKNFDLPVVGFDPSAPEAALLDALLASRRVGDQVGVLAEGIGQAVSEDGALFAVVRGDGTTIVRRTADGESFGVAVPSDPTVPVVVAISSDGKRLAIAAEEGMRYRIDVWDIATGQRIGAPLTAASTLIFMMTFSPDGSQLAVASQPDSGTEAHIWDIASGSMRLLADAPADGIAFSLDGKTMATADQHGTQLWDARTLEPIGELIVAFARPPSGIDLASVAFTPDSKALLIGSTAGSIAVWYIGEKQVIEEAHNLGRIIEVKASSDGKLLGALAEDGSVLVWRADDFQLYGRTRLNPGGRFAFDSEADRVVTLFGGQARNWQVGTPMLAHTGDLLPDRSALAVLAMGPSGHELAAERREGLIQKLYLFAMDPAPRQVATMDFPPADQPVSLAYSADGRFLARASGSDVWLIDRQGDGRKRISGFAGTAGTIAVSAGGETLAWIAGNDGGLTLRLWNIAADRQVGTSVSVDATADSLAFSPDGKTLAVGSISAPTILVDAATGTVRRSAIAGRGQVRYSAAGRLLGTTLDAQGNRVFQLWDTATEGAHGSARPDAIRAREIGLSFTDDGRIVIGGSSNALSVVEVADGRMRGDHLFIQDIADFAAMDADAHYLTVLGSWGNYWIWDIDRAAHLRGRPLMETACRELLPGMISVVWPSELAAAPLLDAWADGDACR